MEGMTNEQYKDAKETLILLVIEMIKGSSSIDEAVEKVKTLLPQKNT